MRQLTLVKNKNVLITISGIIVLMLLLAILASKGGPILLYRAHQNAKVLKSLKIVEGKSYGVGAQPNGDALFGTAAPATELYEVKGTLQQKYDELSFNLEHEGFTMTQEFHTLDLGNHQNGTDILTIQTDAFRQGKEINIALGLANDYQCPNATTCNSKVLSDKHLMQQAISRVQVEYDGYKK